MVWPSRPQIGNHGNIIFCIGNSSGDERTLGEELKILSELQLGFDLEQSALRSLRSTSSWMASTQCPRPILMIACQMSQSLRPLFPVIYGSWASVRQGDYSATWLAFHCR
jgi:hypothetical protein